MLAAAFTTQLTEFHADRIASASLHIESTSRCAMKPSRDRRASEITLMARTIVSVNGGQSLESVLL